MTISAMTEAHWPQVCAIYQAGSDTGHATFASSPPASWEIWQQDHLNELSLVADVSPGVVGWASLVAVSGRCVYAGVAEVSIYVAPESAGQGVGRHLLTALIDRAEANNIWTLQAGIFPENRASIALHTVVEFERVGLRHRLGKMSYGPMAGRWRDVLLLERRSDRVGAD